MELRAPRLNVPVWVEKPLEWLAIGLLAPIFLPAIGIAMLADKLEQRIGTEWHPYFAWWPTRCDEWPDGFVGTVWLETIERRREVYPRWGITFRRAPQPSACEAAQAASVGPGMKQRTAQ